VPSITALCREGERARRGGRCGAGLVREIRPGHEQADGCDIAVPQYGDAQRLAHALVSVDGPGHGLQQLE
jgi:hypothetical protein